MVVEAGLTKICGAETTCDGCPAANLSQAERQALERAVDAVVYYATGYGVGELTANDGERLAKETDGNMAEIAAHEATHPVTREYASNEVVQNVVARLASGVCKHYIVIDRGI